MIRVRKVPDNLHRKLKEQAALAGMSLSDFLLAESLEAQRLRCDNKVSSARGHTAIVEMIQLRERERRFFFSPRIPL